MACGCKDDKKTKPIGAAMTLNDNDFVQAEYIGPGGNRHVQGSFLFDHDPGLPSKKIGTQFVIYYGYLSGGRGIQRLVYREDLRLNPNLWREVPKIVAPPPVQKPQIEAPKPIKPPKIINEVTLDIEQLPGVTPAIAKRMREMNITSKEDIINAGVAGLSKIKGVAKNRATVILKAVEQD